MKSILEYQKFPIIAPSIVWDKWNDEVLSDVILATMDNKHVRAHKVILSLRSTFFKNIFRKNFHQNPLIYLKDIQYEYLDLILEFIYSGKCDVEEPKIVQFLSVGKDLGIIGLMEEMVSIDKNIKMENNIRDDVGHMENGEVESVYEQQNWNVKTIVNKNGKTINSDSSSHGNREFGCNKCEDVYRSRSRLNKHMKLAHKEVSYDCNQCESTFTGQRSLDTHKKSIHNGGKYQCDQCDSQFTEKGSLKKHIKPIHEGVKYYCNQCESTFTQMTNLTNHMKSIHEGIKYYCSYCASRFTEKRHLTRHIKSIHEQIKYYCHQCDSTFNRPDRLSTHIKLIHGSWMSQVLL